MERYFATNILRHPALPYADPSVVVVGENRFCEAEAAGRFESVGVVRIPQGRPKDSALEDAVAERFAARAAASYHHFGGPVFEPAAEKAQELH